MLATLENLVYFFILLRTVYQSYESELCRTNLFQLIS
jgi:hypothetical protein